MRITEIFYENTSLFYKPCSKTVQENKINDSCHRTKTWKKKHYFFHLYRVLGALQQKRTKMFDRELEYQVRGREKIGSAKTNNN